MSCCRTLSEASRLPSLLKVAICVLILSGGAGTALGETQPANGMVRTIDRAVGISDTFGRWTGSIQLVYDPDDAPQQFQDADRFRQLLEQATGQWERVSGVRFDVLEPDASIPDDYEGLVHDEQIRISWDQLEAGVNGRAGIVFGNFDPDIGYKPYLDGRVQLNRDDAIWGSNDELVLVLAHELGHILGLAHSDNPASVMFASPYNHLRFPREDDIRAVQVLYGQPAEPVPSNYVLPEWLFQPPIQAGPELTPYLFAKNQHSRSDNGAYFMDHNEKKINRVDDNTEGGWIYLAASIGDFQNPVPIDRAVTMVLVDPDGYEYKKWGVQLSCDQNVACFRLFGVARSEIMRTVPGNWHLYVLDDISNTSLFATVLMVASKVDYNLPPLAAMQLAATGEPNRVRFIINADDPEHDNIRIVWHPPVADDETESTFIDIPGSNGLVSREIVFPALGTQVFYIELMDTSASGTYIFPGSGAYRNLLKVTVDLPLTDTSFWQFEASVPAGRKQQRLLKAIATMPADPQFVRTTFGGRSPVNFLFGASADEGRSSLDSFRSGESVVIAGSVLPKQQDIGSAAEVFLVVSLDNGSGVIRWFFRNSQGKFVPWTDGNLDSLEPAFLVENLGNSEGFELYTGPLARAELEIYLGYRKQGSAELHYTAAPFLLHVSD